MSEPIHVVCPHCDSINRLPADRPAGEAKCGRCHQPLFTGHPLALEEGRAEKHIARNDIPVLVDFWAQWCGPCKMMAPVFEQAAARLEPRVRLIKVDTDRARILAGQAGIRSIPSLLLYRRGREVARTAGAMDLRTLLDWVEQNL
ncbi:MAG TPA: thioredoxin TrxC [Thiotrichales bacterium]|nr:thioredoxin TrxC [Thiotrichales bacterium]